MTSLCLVLSVGFVVLNIKDTQENHLPKSYFWTETTFKWDFLFSFQGKKNMNVQSLCVQYKLGTVFVTRNRLSVSNVIFSKIAEMFDHFLFLPNIVLCWHLIVNGRKNPRKIKVFFSMDGWSKRPSLSFFQVYFVVNLTCQVKIFHMAIFPKASLWSG